MVARAVPVPIRLLLSPDLPAAAKLIWMVTALGSPADRLGTGWLAATTGLSRPTVRKGLAQLAAAGWDPAGTPASGPTLAMPAALLTDRRLGFRARVLYGCLLVTPGFCHPFGQFTYPELASQAHVDRKTVIRAVDELARAEWLTAERASARGRVSFSLTSPGLARALAALDAAEWRLGKAKHHGEGLMREYLSLLVDSEEYEDDAAPGFLVNPRTGEHLQLDRFYPPRVAFEFNGAQHYHETERYSAEQVVRQRERDYIKLGICVSRGITLVVVHPEDLTLQGMQQKVPSMLPSRNLTGWELLADFLDDESETYRCNLARSSWGAAR